LIRDARVGDMHDGEGQSRGLGTGRGLDRFQRPRAAAAEKEYRGANE
jgi:hypothetical protein